MTPSGRSSGSVPTPTSSTSIQGACAPSATPLAGHLAGLVGTTEASDDFDPELAGVSSRVDCVVSISGDVDFMVPSADQEWTEMVHNPVCGGTVEEVPEVWQAASPTGVDLEAFIRAAEDPDTHGTLAVVEQHAKNERIVIAVE